MYLLTKKYQYKQLLKYSYLEKILFYTHLIGFAAVAGGLIAQAKATKRVVTPIIIFGARWQMLSGLALGFVIRHDVRPLVIGLKLVGAILILTLADIWRKKPQLSRRQYLILCAVVALQTLAAIFVSRT